MKKWLAFLTAAALVCGLLLTGCGSGGASQSSQAQSGTTQSSDGGSEDGTYYTWSLSCEYSAENHQTIALEDAADKIEELTDGHIQITVYPNMALGDYTVVYSQVMTGDIEIAACPISPQYDPRVDIINMPYLSSNFDEFAKYYFEGSYMWNLFEEITSSTDVKLLGFFNAGFMGLGAKSLDYPDFATLTDGSVTKSTLMRCPASTVYAVTMSSLGYNTTTIPYADLYSALQSGLCDGWLGGSGLVNYDSFRDAIKCFIDVNIINECIPVMMNQELFESLPAEYQTIITDVFNEMQVRVNNERQAQESQALVDLAAYDITIIQPTPEETAALRDRVRKEVWPQMAEILGQETIDELCNIYGVVL